MSSLKDFFESKEYKDNSSGKGLPEGDSFFELAKLKLSLKEKNFDGKQTTSFFLQAEEGTEGFYIPSGVAKAIEKIFKDNQFPIARITRVGLTKTETRYTVIGVLKK